MFSQTDIILPTQNTLDKTEIKTIFLDTGVFLLS